MVLAAPPWHKPLPPEDFHGHVIGHGIQDGDRVFCCAHCARKLGVTDVVDNAAHANA